MRCPYCGFEDSKVTDSRSVEGGVRRRRQCLGCDARFTTLERLQRSGLLVVKRDGRREEFSREKVLGGIRKACTKRAIPAATMEALADEIEALCLAQARSEIPSTFIGELVMDRLREIDQIAYIRFASVYRAFADVDELKEELLALERRRSGPHALPGQLPLLPQEPDEQTGAQADGQQPKLTDISSMRTSRKRVSKA